MKASTPRRHPPALLPAVLGLLMLALLAAGCASGPKPQSNALAEVLITGATRDQIVTNMLHVFRRNGFALATTGTYDYSFERDASTWDNLAYSSWSGERVIIRVKLRIDPQGDATHLVTADAYRVVDPADPRMSEERKLSRAKRGRYQDLLNDLQKRCIPAPALPEGSGAAKP